MSESLPDLLPDSPMSLFTAWFEHACQKKIQNNPDAMTLATVDADGRPSARIVLCKHLVSDPGYLVFFTNYESRKGQALSAHPYAASVFHWDSLERQVRIEGRIVKSPGKESDAYFASRPIVSQLGAWASEQSQPLTSRAQLAAQVAMVSARFAMNTLTNTIPRPPHWGGFRLWIEHMELWVAGTGRVHDRARWSRQLQPLDEHQFACSAWQATRLNP